MDIELLAEAVHEVWANWMRYMLAQGRIEQSYDIYTMSDAPKEWVMPADKLERWTWQMETPYDDLSEKEKESDREIALQYLQLIEEYQADGA
jgi:hypothetical protein